MQSEIEQVRAEFAAWAAAQTDEGIKLRCQIILDTLRRLSADPENEALRQQALRNVAGLRLYGALASTGRGKTPAPAPLVESLI
jgi:hypothetical protein